MTASATDPHDLSSVAEPLTRLAPWGARLAVWALAAALLALGGYAAGHGVLALAAGAVSATLAVLILASGLAVRGQRQRLSTGAGAIALALADDPDPVLVTDLDGALRAANRAGRDCDGVAAALGRWCADPRRMAQALAAEVGRTGRLSRNFIISDNGLRVDAHVAGSAHALIVWRFAPVPAGPGRGLSSLGLPVVTLRGGQLTVNEAGRGALDAPDGALAHLVAELQQDLPQAPRVVSAGAAGQALVLPARDGADIVPLPALAAGVPVAAAVRPRDFEDIPVALARLDRGGRIVGSNRLARGLLGLTEGEGHNFWEVVEGLGRPVSDWLDDARAGRALGRPEVLRATLTAQETFVQIILRRAGGVQDDGLVAVISDATELKSLEARFVQSQKMQAIGQLAGGIAHDFNNLLTAISGHCDLLLLNRDRFDPDYNDLLQIHQNANRAAALVRQLLAFSRKQTMKAETFRPESLLEDLTHLLTRLVGERITLTLSHDPALGAIRADRRQLEQVIMNLVVNARDAMPMGGTIRIETEATHLARELEHGRARVPPGDYALIRVIDEGVGIPRDIIDKIFEPFFTTKRLGEGTGLGLSTAYGIVKQMGGYIFADSVEGAGTTFTLYFGSQPAEAMAPDAPPKAPKRPARPIDGEPDTPPEPPLARRPPPPTPEPDRGGTILLVEDEAPVRAFAARALRLQGYQVFEAQDGEQALEFLEDRSLTIDLFVTDVIMPGIDGPGWVAQALAARPGTPVVFVSGYTEDTLSAALGRTPRAVFLGKPFSLRELSETIDRQMRAAVPA
ncbi:MAG: response regulator [Rhodobacter sp.]|nr:response regulator [Paracoccaceae bacterium]MCC0076833.1 response regulator [Rhodobacter sp.]